MLNYDNKDNVNVTELVQYFVVFKTTWLTQFRRLNEENF